MLYTLYKYLTFGGEIKMPWYVKISYRSNGSNQALIKAISYIGKYYYHHTDNYYKDGITYLAKKVRGASKRSIKLMINQRKIKNNSYVRQWCFKYRVYRRVYRYILQCLVNGKYGDKEEAKEILHSLYFELKKRNCDIKNEISDIIVSEEKEILGWAIDKSQYKIYQKEIEAILNTFKECDDKFSPGF